MLSHAEESRVDYTESLRVIAINSAYQASRALSKWFRKGVRLRSDGFAHMPIAAVADLAGSPEEPVVAAHMRLEGGLTGDVLLVFPERNALLVVDQMLGVAEGTTQSIGEMEASCVQETGNIVGTAFVNCLANWLNVECIPAAPVVVHDLACAVIEPVVVKQAMVADEALISKTEFEMDGKALEWFFLLLPSADSLDLIRGQSNREEFRQNALHAIAVNGAFDASRAMSKWIRRGIKLSTEGFERVPLIELFDESRATEEVVALHLELGSQLHGHSLMLLSMNTALELSAVLMNTGSERLESLDEMARSCLQETGNIISTAFVNSWAKWLEIHTEPQPPLLDVDMLGPILQSVIVEQAQVSDEIFVARTSFSMGGRWLDWAFYFLPSPSSLRLIEASIK